jgi:hypothetical protein
MQSQPPDMLISMIPFLLIYGGVSALALRKRNDETDRKNGWRRWRWMNLYIIGAMAISALSIWWRQSDS